MVKIKSLNTIFRMIEKKFVKDIDVFLMNNREFCAKIAHNVSSRVKDYLHRKKLILLIESSKFGKIYFKKSQNNFIENKNEFRISV